MAKSNFGILFLVVLINGGYCSSEYGQCVVYEESESMDLTKDRYCLDIDSKKYCLEWDCLPIPCTNPVKRRKFVCPYCPGTCNYGGNVHYLYERFTCPDGVNSCSCTHKNAVLSSKIKVHSPDQMCKPGAF